MMVQTGQNIWNFSVYYVLHFDETTCQDSKAYIKVFRLLEGFHDNSHVLTKIATRCRWQLN